MIALADASSNPLYSVFLEIAPSRHRAGYNGPSPSPYYDECTGEPVIFASLADYISIVDSGTISIQIPASVMRKMHGNRTYDVYLRIEDQANDDARQILIGKLPILFGGRGP